MVITYWCFAKIAERYYFERQRKCEKFVIFDHHIIKKSQICSLNKLTSKELYLILVNANTVKPTVKDYFENLFQSSQFNWKKMFLIHNTTLNSKARMFQLKVLHNILYTNKMLFQFVKVIPSRRYFCKLHDETIMHLFYEWLIVKSDDLIVEKRLLWLSLWRSPPEVL